MSCRQGRLSRSGSHSRGGQVGTGQADRGYFRLYPRYRLVCTPAGCLQADAECEERRYRGGAGGDHRLLWYDPLRRHGFRDSDRQDYSGGAEHRPGVRCHQHRHARAVPTDRLWPHSVRFLRGRSGCGRVSGGLGQGPALSGGHHVRHPRKGSPLSGDGRGLLQQAGFERQG